MYDLCELRLDQLDFTPEQINRLLSTDSKIIVTYRDVGANRSAILDQLDWELIDYLDLDISNSHEYIEQWTETARSHQVRMIYSHHDYVSYVSVDDFLARWRAGQFQAASLYDSSCDIIKIASTVDSSIQVREIMEAYEEDEDLILIGMGAKGARTRTHGVQAGARFTYAFPEGAMSAAPGQISAERMQVIHNVQRSDHRLFGVTGRPILHSRSPHLFREFFGTNQYIRLALESIEEIEQWPFLPLDCVNVTSPFKYDATAYVTGSSSIPSNVIDQRAPATSRDNTDLAGIRGAVSQTMKRSPSSVLVVGSGGAAEAGIMAYHSSCPVAICARNQAAVEALDARFDKLSIQRWEELAQIVREYDLVIWTVPSAVAVENEVQFSVHQYVLDANYKDPMTEVKEFVGEQYIPGAQWLLEQAIVLMQNIDPQREINRDALNRAMLTEAPTPQKIAVIGLPSSGKSTVAPLLAERLGWQLVDMDSELSKRAGKSISDIFGQDGERHFRESEQELLAEVSKRENLVLSTGGGIILSAENRKLLQDDFLCIWLVIDPIEASLRSGSADRPLIGEEVMASFANLHQERYRHYASCANLAVLASISPESIADRIYEEYCKVI